MPLFRSSTLGVSTQNASIGDANPTVTVSARVGSNVLTVSYGGCMLGVVLWSDQKGGKAVFWCEDQGDLAYYESSEEPSLGAAGFDAGDMVQFDVNFEQRLRRASNAQLVKEQAYSGLPEKLREKQGGSAATLYSDKVVPLHAHRAVEPALKKRKA